MRDTVRIRPWVQAELRRFQTEVKPWGEMPMTRLRKPTGIWRW